MKRSPFVLAAFTWIWTAAACLQAQSPAADEKPRQDDFPIGQFVSLFDGKTLEGWQVIDKNDFTGHGEVTVEEDAIVMAKGRPATGISFQRPLPRLNYEVRLEAKRIEGNDFFCGLTFPVGKEYLTLILGGWGGGVTGLSNLDNMSAVENETTNYIDFKPNQWYQVRLRVTKERVEAWVNQDQIVDVALGDRKLSIWWEQEPVRPFGIVAWDTKASIRNVQFKRLAEPPSGQQLALLKTFRDEFIAITPGEGKFPKSFTMGSNEGSPFERPAVRVTFDYAFAVGKYEVPQNLWQAVMGENPSLWKGDRNSVEMVSFDDSVSFCQRATELMRAARLIEPTEVIRLPSESEWEYVARAGTETKYSFGDDVNQLDEYAWHTGNAAGNDPPVGAKKPNPWGLYDVHGYLWEWCADVGHENHTGAPTDGTARTAVANVGDKGAAAGDAVDKDAVDKDAVDKDAVDKDAVDKDAVDKDAAPPRVIRGGSWKDPPTALTSSNRAAKFRGAQRGSVVEVRGGVPATLKDDAVGLRCVLAVSSNE